MAGAYEKVYKEEILMCFSECNDYSYDQLAALLALDYPLEQLYQNWLESDASVVDVLRETIFDFADKETTQLRHSGKHREPQAQALNSEIACFDLVISTGDSAYPFLVGEVNAVHKLGTEEHSSDNLEDDVFVDFRVEEYSDNRTREIEQYFSKLYDEPKSFEELPLDNVIMPPSSLIRIRSESEIWELLASRKAAENYCNNVLQSLKHDPPTATPRTISDKIAEGKVRADAQKQQTTNTNKTKNKEII